jgi:hypothetical protein
VKRPEVVLWLFVAVIAILLFAVQAHSASTAPAFSVASVTCPEAGPCSVTVRKSAKASSYSKVRVTTTDGTALAGADYRAVDLTLTFANNQLQQTVAIPLIDDTAVEAREAFTVKLTAVRFAQAGPAATVTITDNDLAPAPIGWKWCADEYGTCTITAGTSAQIRYGANDSWAQRTFSGSIYCSYSIFGDPLPWIGKHCETDGTIAAPTPTPEPPPTPTPTPTPPPVPSQTWVSAPLSVGGYAWIKNQGVCCNGLIVKLLAVEPTGDADPAYRSHRWLAVAFADSTGNLDFARYPDHQSYYYDVDLQGLAPQ